MAIINSKAEEAKLLDMMRKSESLVRGSSNGEEALLGIHDLYKEADWVTIFGEPLASTGYVGWSSTYWNGQPDNRDNRQHCGALINQGGIDDVNYNDKFAFFCELPLAC
uniref:C-type lectin domain-containing protein n=1 Tax=Trichogramma kaykai TaxID=54128 RepID=A0ABD2WDP0_9HYME